MPVYLGVCLSRNLNFNPPDSLKRTLAKECLQSKDYQHWERANFRCGRSTSTSLLWSWRDAKWQASEKYATVGKAIFLSNVQQQILRQYAILFLGAFAILRKATLHFVMSVCLSLRPSACPHGRTRLPLDGFTWNLVFVYFDKIFRENSSFIKIWQEWRVLYMTTNTHFW